MIPGIGAIAPAIGGTNPADFGNTAASNPASAIGGASFASMVADAVGQTVGNMRQAEQASVDALQGKADMRQVVDTVMSAEQSLQAAVAIRDKIVAAYLEVSRMAI